MMPSTSAPRVEHVADGNIVEFNFDFAIFQSGDLEVFLDASRQVDGFTVRGGYPSNGGTVVFAESPAAGTLVILQRRISVERATDFRPSAACVANTLNEEFDRLVAMVQQVLYGVIDATGPISGITLRGTISGGCSGFLIFGNTFENTCSNKDFNCVIIENGSYGLINANIFRTNGAAIATAIWLTSGSSSCRVGSDNIYGTQVMRRVLNQGQSNVIAP